jgi:diguanylate cyclase (GGDEF)-like protein
MNTSPMSGPERFAVDVCSTFSDELIRSRPQHIAVLLRLSMMSGLQMNLNASLAMLCEYAREIVPYNAALVYFWNEKEERSLLRTSEGIPASQRENFQSRNVLEFWTQQHGRPVLVRFGDHPQTDEILASLNSSAALSVPVFVNNRVMGAMQLFTSAENGFTTDDAQLLWMLARVSENLLTREYSNEGLIHFAFTDHLTGLKTRGYFEQQLELEIKRTERKGEGFCLLMLDIDHFKPLNDTYGHHAGDKVLRRVAHVLTKDMREVDTVARYGGEEFVIILPETTEAEAYAVAQRIRAAIEAEHFNFGAAHREPVTISIGVAVFGQDATTRKQLVQRADAALYVAKGQGRNKVVRYSEMTTASPQSRQPQEPQREAS